MIDEDVLRAVLDDAASGFEPPADAPTVIVAAATTPSHRPAVDDAPRAPRTWRARSVLAVAAVILVVAVVALTSIGLALQAGTDRPRNEGLVSVLGHRDVSFGTLEGGTSLSGPAAPSLSMHAITFSETLAKSATGTSSKTASQPLASKIVSTGTVSLDVSSGTLEGLLTKLNNLAARDGGFVASSSVTAGPGGAAATSTGSVTLRVPQPRFGSLVDAVQHVGRATSVVTSSNDVTSEYVDYESQISALEASRAQYLAIMTKATTISQILQVQAQLNTIESQIQQLEGQRNVLVNQAAYGTLTVRLNPGAHPTRPPAQSGISRAWHNSVGGFVTGVEGLVTAIGPAIFAALCLIVLLLVGRSAWRATRRRMI